MTTLETIATSPRTMVSARRSLASAWWLIARATTRMSAEHGPSAQRSLASARSAILAAVISIRQKCSRKGAADRDRQHCFWTQVATIDTAPMEQHPARTKPPRCTRPSHRVLDLATEQAQRAAWARWLMWPEMIDTKRVSLAKAVATTCPWASCATRAATTSTTEIAMRRALQRTKRLECS